MGTVRAQRRDNLLRLAHRHMWIVGPVDDEERGGNRVDMANRRDRFEEVAVVLQAPIFRLAQLPPPGSRVLQEGGQR